LPLKLKSPVLHLPESEALLQHAGLNRILIVTDAWAPQVNGVVRTLRTITAEMQAMGKTVEIIGPDQFNTIPMPSYPEIRLAMFPGRKLGKLIDAFAPDALHIATEGPLGMAARAYAKKRKIAFTTAFHTRFAEYLEARTRIPSRLTYTWLRWFHGAGSGVMVATQSLRDELTARGFKNVRAWSRGVDLEAFHLAQPENWNLPHPIFAYVGRVAVEKNLRAFLDLSLPGSKLVVGDGPQRKTLEREYPNAHFAGARFGAELAAAYAGADVFVFPSKTDTFGLVVLEALACGLPVAAYNVTGPKDILGESPKPVGALNDNLQTAALDALKIDRRNCRPHAETYSWTACAQRFLDNLVPLKNYA
jgi:glycosyltransferase involved in cell wall biosynthesis